MRLQKRVNIALTICNNAEINKDFYIKQALGNNEAYISDYFVDIVIKLNDDYGDLIYTNYEDLSFSNPPYTVLYHTEYSTSISLPSYS